MPSRRPQAAFEPLAPNLDLHALVESTPHFEWAVRINCDMIDHHGIDQFERLVLVHVVLGGKPLVIDNYDSRLDKWTFAVQWLRDNWGQKIVDARDLTAEKNVPLTVQHYLKNMALLTNQWDDKNYKDKERQRMYLKDIDCPPIWAEKVRDHVPLGMFYMNESTGDIDGFGASEEQDPSVSGSRKGRGVSKAGDLMSSLPKEMRAENLMCYIGHEGTYTPAHREMCASLGHNIMVEASTATIEDGKLTKPGSSVWFMTETKEREVVSEYWLSRLGHDIEIEKHFAQLNAWRQAPFQVYVIEQTPGDLILIPPLAPHQVWNRGTRTMKVAWNRTTVETLEMAMNEALPKARMVCRDEQYKNKAIIYFTLQKYSKLLKIADKQKKNGMKHGQNDVKVRQLEKDFKRLQGLFTRVMVSESFLADKPEKKIELVPYDSNITCSYCRCNIFNRFLTCKSCVEKLPDGDDDTYDVCMDCYAMGRSCACISNLSWVEQWSWNELKDKHELFRRQIIETEGKVDSKSPKSLRIELDLLGKKRTLAQVCQLELARRPFHNINDSNENGKDFTGVEREETDEVDADGNTKKKKKVRRSEKYKREHGRCHVDCYWEPKWKQAHCSNCDKNYCYGNLYRAYDMMPQDIMADSEWKCPSCRKICGCRHCRHKPGFKQYTPKGTLLGHNTRAVADARSVESLVDFSFSNISWIQKAGDDHEEDTRRLRRRLREAEVAKANNPQLGEEEYVGGDSQPLENVDSRILQLAEQEGIPIDPALGMVNASHESGDLIDIDDDDSFVAHPEEAPTQWTDVATGDIGGPTYQVPEGGIIWNDEHAYDPTDAITYIYPDLETSVQLPLPPANGYTPALIPGYEPAVPPKTNNAIEMVDHKRKRPKLDEGDKPYAYKKAYNPKSRARKSLVVKLGISKEKLAKLDNNASIAKRALDVIAPVISSDLQALNVEHQNVEGQPISNKVHIESATVEEQDEQDDEFTPGRYRDRRKPVLDGEPRPAPDADITRRTTRMQAITYAEPDEDEFTEIANNDTPSSKLATMEKAVHDIDTLIDSTNDDFAEMPRLNTHQESVKAKSAIKLPLERPLGGPIHPEAAPASNGARSRKSVDIVSSHTIRAASSEDDTRPISSHSAVSDKVSSKVVAQAQANRRAKMAAIEGASDDLSEDMDSGWSDSSARTDHNAASDHNSTKESTPAPVPSTARPVHRTVAGKTPRFSLPSNTLGPPKPPGPKPATKVVSVQKVSAADWGDDSSDDDLPLKRKAVPVQTASGFMAVNAHTTNAMPNRNGPAKAGKGGRLSKG